MASSVQAGSNWNDMEQFILQAGLDIWSAPVCPVPSFGLDLVQTFHTYAELLCTPSSTNIRDCLVFLVMNKILEQFTDHSIVSKLLRSCRSVKRAPQCSKRMVSVTILKHQKSRMSDWQSSKLLALLMKINLATHFAVSSSAGVQWWEKLLWNFVCSKPSVSLSRWERLIINQ